MTQKVPQKMPLQADITNQANNVSVRSNKMPNFADSHGPQPTAAQKKLNVGSKSQLYNPTSKGLGRGVSPQL